MPLMKFTSIPRAAFCYGMAGLLPVIVCTAISFLMPNYSLTAAYIATVYAGIILSFLGGILWGFAAGNTTVTHELKETLGLSVLPALMGWVALLLPLPWLPIAILILAHAVQVWIDYIFHENAITPAWYLPLRLMLSLGLLICLVALLVHQF